MAKLLTIDLEKEYKLRIEDFNEIKTSFFKDVYKQAFEQVKNIEKWSSDSLKNQSKEIFSRESREYNNIIAFTGERGTGKSSAMLTVANALVNYPATKIELDENGSKYDFKAHFESLHTIDPSKFEKHQNIIEIILAELFDKFQTQIKDANNQYNDNDKRTVLKAFQDVYQCLKEISYPNQTKKFEGDALETLAKLADATKLEKNIQSLIKEYLKFIHPDKAQGQSILIIPIDDFDLNVKHAGEMAEQIRKYLMIPQVMVLMAINLEQFGDVKTQDVIGDFQTLFTRSEMSESPRDVAARYILKLIPIERRILIPSIRIERNEVTLELKRDSEVFITNDDTKRIEKQIFDYLYKSTGLYFVSNANEYHSFFPTTLRELWILCNALGSFQNIIEVDDEVEKSKKKKNNLEIFKVYFQNTWIKDYLLTPFKNMIDNSSTILYSNWNKYFITSTVEILSKEEKYKSDWLQTQDNKETIYNREEEITNIIDRKNYPTNVSLGDFIYFTEFIKRVYIYDKDIQKLIFGLNCWYSININALYYDDKKTIKDFVNGTVVNKEMGVIRNTTTYNRLQLAFQTKYKKDDKTTEYKFIKNNIFIKHTNLTDTKIKKENAKYRLLISYVCNEVFEDSMGRFKNPTFNLFSFAHKDEENIFPIPYNNLELWNDIIDKVDRDYKSGATDATLISHLFSQIFKYLKNEEMHNSFINNDIVSLFIDERGEMKFKKKSDKAEFVTQVYGNVKIKTSIESVEDESIEDDDLEEQANSESLGEKASELIDPDSKSSTSETVK